MSGRVIVPVDTQIDQIRDHCEQHRLVWMFVPNGGSASLLLPQRSITFGDLSAEVAGLG